MVETYAAVRRFVLRNGGSRREAARVFGPSRGTVAKMCRYSAPPGYVRSKPAGKPKRGALLWVTEVLLEADRGAPAKQRHTAKWSKAPTPADARRFTEKQVGRILAAHRIRRITAADAVAILQRPALTVAPGTVEAARAHIATTAERLRWSTDRLRTYPPPRRPGRATGWTGARAAAGSRAA